MFGRCDACLVGEGASYITAYITKIIVLGMVYIYVKNSAVYIIYFKTALKRIKYIYDNDKLNILCVRQCTVYARHTHDSYKPI